MRIIVKKRGKSASVRIPAAIMTAAKVRLGQAVDVREERGRIIIEPIRTAGLELKILVSGITEDNRHDEIDFEKPFG